LTKTGTYWQQDKVKIANLSFPSYVSNTTASLALSQGQIDWGGNDIANIDKVFVAKDPEHNKYWFAPVNVVTLTLNTTKAPLNDARSAPAPTVPSCPPWVRPATSRPPRRPAACCSRASTTSTSTRR